MRNKPIRFGIKVWALCASNGFLLNLDINCGKNDCSIDKKLSKCTLGSRAVMKMLHDFFVAVKESDIPKFHVYFDNFFTSPDLMVHLKKLCLRSTGTVRDDRVFTKEMFPDNNNNNNNDNKGKNGKPKKSEKENPERKRLLEKHKISKDTNCITVLDSKPISLLSTAAGATPLVDVERLDKEEKKKSQ